MSNSNHRSLVVIVGAGPVGCVCALAMKKLGHNVAIFESRGNPLVETRGTVGLRSINLALSPRGIETLKMLGKDIFDKLESKLVPMRGRMVHDVDGTQTSILYTRDGQCINSISRSLLNNTLLEEVLRSDIKVHFNHRLRTVSIDGYPETLFETPTGPVKIQSNVVVGCDGSNSILRQEIQRVSDMVYSQEYIDHFYLEILMPSQPTEDGSPGYLWDPNHLHVWPRSDFLFIALANRDGSFTCTLFAPRQLFAQLTTPELFVEFFQKNFGDVVAGIGTEQLAAYFKNPRGKLLNVRCSQYHYKSRAIILGDAAHCMVPFYGQGLNCGFEDVRVLMGYLEEFKPKEAFSKYSTTRKADLDAINDLSMANYLEMRHSVTTRTFAIRKFIDGMLHTVLGERWLPLYTMVTFRPDIRYSEALSRSHKQSRILARLMRASLITGISAVALATAALIYRDRVGQMLGPIFDAVYSTMQGVGANVLSGVREIQTVSTDLARRSGILEHLP